MLNHWQLLRVDLFSVRHQGEPWICLQWLGECLMAAGYRLGGFDLLLQLSVIGIAGVYAWLFHRLWSAGWHWLVAFVAVIIGVWAAAYHFHVRPHLFTIAFVVWTFAWLCDVEAKKRSLQQLFVLIPVVVLWTNLHPGVYAGIAFVGFVGAGWVALWILGLPSPVSRWRDVGILTSVILSLCLAIFVNPFGLELPRATFSILESPVVRKLILEQRPLDPLNPDYLGILLLGGYYVWALWRYDWKQPRPTLLIPLILLIMTFNRIRHGPLFAVTALLGLASMTGVNPWLQSHVGYQVGDDQPRKFKPWPVFAFVAVVFAIQAMGLHLPVIGRGWARLNRDAAPLETLDALQDFQNSVPAGTGLLNELNYGGFIIRFAPKLRVLVDDRCELYGDEELSQYLQMVTAKPEISERLAQQWDLRGALVHQNGVLDLFLKDSPNWSSITCGSGACLYVRWPGTKKPVAQTKISGQSAEKKP